MMVKIFSNVLKRYGRKTGRRQFTIISSRHCSQEHFENLELDTEIVRKEYEFMLGECLDKNPHRCYVIQPYIKWGPSRSTDRSPSQRLQEGVQLAKFLQNWSVVGGETFGVRSARYTLGSGQLRNLSDTIKNLGGVTSLVANIPLLNSSQVSEMRTQIYGNPKIYDRAGIVLRLVREQVTNGTHADAQLQLAELDYVSKRFRDERSNIILATRRTQLNAQLEICKEQRELLRKKRKNNDLPIVAVIGYTNAGKSSLVSALVGTKVCSVSAKAFHTLEVIGRASELPSGLRILYMDTVGFLSDVPKLVAPLFSATLEDVLLADCLLHVVDSSHEEVEQQKNHVVTELQKIYSHFKQALPPVITVGNKLDLRKSAQDLKLSKNDTSSTQNCPNWDIAVSALQDTGIDALRLRLEEEVLRATNRLVISFRVSFGSEEARWLYKNSTVLEQVADQNESQLCIIKTIITKVKIDQFYSYFVKKKKII